MERGLLEADKIRRCEVDALVDSGATRSVIPARIADELGLIIKAATLGPVDVLSGLTISEPVLDELQLVLASDSGLVSGTVVDNDHKPISGASIVLIPDYQRDRPDLYRFSHSDQNCHFQLSPAVPGDYKLFAWQDLEPCAYNNQDFLRKSEEVGSKVKITEFRKLTVELKVIPGIE